MKCKDREGNIVSNNEGQDKLLHTLYDTKAGRVLLKVLVQPEVSKLGSAFLDSRFSKPIITPFIRKNQLDMSPYEDEEYESYNHFFTRRIKKGMRPFAEDTDRVCAPCDSKLSVYPIDEDGTFEIKNTIYTMESLLRSKKLAKHYQGGILCVFRLTVDDYHHYAYIDEGTKTKNYHIPGVFHTVNPVANDAYPVYTENTREFSILKSEHFGNILMMEVGALLVGKIVNHHEECKVHRGMEKGYFEFGGSTVILAFEKNQIEPDADILANWNEGYETVVKLGEGIGTKKKEQ